MIRNVNRGAMMSDDLAPQGKTDLAYLCKALGERLRPIEFRDGYWEVEMIRLDGRRVWAFGSTPEAALARARKSVERWLAEQKGKVCQE